MTYRSKININKQQELQNIASMMRALKTISTPYLSIMLESCQAVNSMQAPAGPDENVSVSQKNISISHLFLITLAATSIPMCVGLGTISDANYDEIIHSLCERPIMEFENVYTSLDFNPKNIESTKIRNICTALEQDNMNTKKEEIGKEITQELISSRTTMNYALWQQIDFNSLLEQLAELFNLYFPEPYTTVDWEEFLETMIKAFTWTGAAVTSGVIGNLAYDILKKRLHKHTRKPFSKNRLVWKIIEDDFNKILEIAIEESMDHYGISVRHAMERTGITDKEKVKYWFKVMGGSHAHAGHLACRYHFSQDQDTDLLIE